PLRRSQSMPYAVIYHEGRLARNFRFLQELHQRRLCPGSARRCRKPVGGYNSPHWPAPTGQAWADKSRAGEHMERTLIILKPDCVQRRLIGRIVQRFEDKGLVIAGMKLIQI